TVEYPNFNIEVRRCFESGVDDLPPLIRKEFNLSISAFGQVIETNVTDKSPVDTGLFHGVQVVDNPLLGNIVRNPVPVNRGLNGVGRLNEYFRNRIPVMLDSILLRTAFHQQQCGDTASVPFTFHKCHKKVLGLKYMEESATP